MCENDVMRWPRTIKAIGITLLALASLSVFSAERAAARSYVVDLAHHPDTALTLTYHAMTSDTQPYPLDGIGSAAAGATIEIELDPDLGLVVTSIRFDLFSTYNPDVVHVTQDEFMGAPFLGRAILANSFGDLTVADLPAVATGAHSSSFDVAPLDYWFYYDRVDFSLWDEQQQSWVYTGSTELSEFPMVFPLTGTGTVLVIPTAGTGAADVRVTLPIDVFSSTWFQYEFQGNLVLQGSIPIAGAAVPIAPVAGWISALIMAAAGRRKLAKLRGERSGPTLKRG